MDASAMSPTRRHSQGRPHRRLPLLRIGAALTSLVVWATPHLSLAAGKNPALLELASAGLTDAEMARETGAGLDAPILVPNVTSPQPRVILWDELHHSSQSGMITDAATVTIRVFP
jgi:hypothetical protein